MPWLYYIDKSDIVTKYRGITMQMSLSDQTGYEHTLTFIAAKYTVDGNFLGFVNLVDELMYCGGNLKPEWFSFGKNRQIEYQCDLNDLLKVEAFFYDLFITDTAMKKSHITNTGENFLYPVPVLSPNFVESGKLPNSNKNKNDEKAKYEEGCLSVPDQFAEIERPNACEVEYLDYDGKKQLLKADGLLATCIQHEMDHLEGILFIDYLSKLKKSIIIKKLSKVKANREIF